VPAGPYLVLPFFGPSSPRGTLGLVGDAAMNPLSYTLLVGGSLSTVASLSATGARAVETVDNRADLIKVEKIATEAAIDRYAFFRDAYLQRRRCLIYDGEVPEDQQYDFDVDIDFDDDLDDLEEVE
jgi:phospholipid-binding lipoprotein MlaA